MLRSEEKDVGQKNFKTCKNARQCQFSISPDSDALFESSHDTSARARSGQTRASFACSGCIYYFCQKKLNQSSSHKPCDAQLQVASRLDTYWITGSSVVVTLKNCRLSYLRRGFSCLGVSLSYTLSYHSTAPQVVLQVDIT